MFTGLISFFLLVLVRGSLVLEGRVMKTDLLASANSPWYESLSQAEPLRCCRLARDSHTHSLREEDDDPLSLDAGLPLESTGIIMLSPPCSSDDDNDAELDSITHHDVSQQQESVVNRMGDVEETLAAGGKTMISNQQDNSRLGFSSSVAVREIIETTKVIQCESEVIRVSQRELGVNIDSCERAKKKQKVLSQIHHGLSSAGDLHQESKLEGTRVLESESTLNAGLCDCPMENPKISGGSLRVLSPKPGLGSAVEKDLTRTVKTMEKLGLPLLNSSDSIKSTMSKDTRVDFGNEMEKGDAILSSQGNSSHKNGLMLPQDCNVTFRCNEKYDKEIENVGSFTADPNSGTTTAKDLKRIVKTMEKLGLPLVNSLRIKKSTFLKATIDDSSNQMETREETPGKCAKKLIPEGTGGENCGSLVAHNRQETDGCNGKVDEEMENLGVSTPKPGLCTIADKDLKRIAKTMKKLGFPLLNSSKSSNLGAGLKPKSRCLGTEEEDRREETSGACTSNLSSQRIIIKNLEIEENGAKELPPEKQQSNDSRENAVLSFKKSTEKGLSNENEGCKFNRICNVAEKSTNICSRTANYTDKEGFKGKRLLPASMQENMEVLPARTRRKGGGRTSENAKVIGEEEHGNDLYRKKDSKDVTVWQVLKILADNNSNNHDLDLETLTLFEVLQRRGMTFP